MVLLKAVRPSCIQRMQPNGRIRQFVFVVNPLWFLQLQFTKLRFKRQIEIMFRTLTEPVELSFISMEEVMAWY